MRTGSAEARGTIFTHCASDVGDKNHKTVCHQGMEVRGAGARTVPRPIYAPQNTPAVAGTVRLAPTIVRSCVKSSLQFFAVSLRPLGLPAFPKSEKGCDCISGRLFQALAPVLLQNIHVEAVLTPRSPRSPAAGACAAPDLLLHVLGVVQRVFCIVPVSLLPRSLAVHSPVFAWILANANSLICSAHAPTASPYMSPA